MSNTTAGYDVAVAYADSIYRTVGASFELGGLLDNQTCNKTGYVAEILSFFGVSYLWTDVRTNTAPESDVVAYPNPFTNTVYFKSSATSNKPALLQVYNLQGKLIYTQSTGAMAGGKMLFWDVTATSATPGIYFYRIISDNQKSTGKIVLEK